MPNVSRPATAGVASRICADRERSYSFFESLPYPLRAGLNYRKRSGAEGLTQLYPT